MFVSDEGCGSMCAHVTLEQWAIGVCLCVNEWASERHIAEILDKSTIKCNHVFTLANKQRACGSIETISMW